VLLTEAGRALWEDGRRLLAASEAARDRVRRTGRGEVGEVRAGHMPAVTGGEVAELARALRACREGISFSARQLYPGELVERLLAGELDVGVARQMGQTPGLAVKTIARQPLRVAVAADHRLAGRDEIGVAELAEETIVVWGRPGRSGYADFLVGVCRGAGFEPRIKVNPIQGTPPVTAAAVGGEVAFVTDPSGRSADGRTMVLEMWDAPRVALQALWPEQSASLLVAEFLAALAAARPDL
jgi:DNA-binding transcriptional LysR family regulator